ncbi:putative nuclease HARBI1, partial [Tanacetum coccineum]
ARGRGDCYQNVLAICDFNMIFTYIVAEWEGTAHDARILNEALDDPIYEFPFRHTRGFMAPYRNVRAYLNSPIGPKTTHFLGPVVIFGFVASVMAGIKKPPEMISGNMTAVMKYKGTMRRIAKGRRNTGRPFQPTAKSGLLDVARTEVALAVLYLTKAEPGTRYAEPYNTGQNSRAMARQGQRKTLTKKVAWLAEFSFYLRYDLYTDDLTFCKKSA